MTQTATAFSVYSVGCDESDCPGKDAPGVPCDYQVDLPVPDGAGIPAHLISRSTYRSLARPHPSRVARARSALESGDVEVKEVANSWTDTSFRVTPARPGKQAPEESRRYDEEMIRLRSLGCPWKEVAKRLGRSEQACQARAAKLRRRGEDI
jgi:hypothetical protein